MMVPCEPKHVGVFIVTFIVTLILFRVDVTSNVHLLDFNKRISTVVLLYPRKFLQRIIGLVNSKPRAYGR
jgi:hypothetical protein